MRSLNWKIKKQIFSWCKSNMEIKCFVDLSVKSESTKCYFIDGNHESINYRFFIHKIIVVVVYLLPFCFINYIPFHIPNRVQSLI